MEKILAITIGVLAVIGVALGFMSDSSSESSEKSSPAELDSYEPDPNEQLTGNPYQDTRIVGGKRKKTKRKRRKKQ